MYSQIARVIAGLAQFSNDPREFLRKLVNKARHILSLFIIDEDTQRFIKHNQKVWHGWTNKHNDSVVLVDSYTVGQTLISYSYFLNILARKHNAEIKSFAAKVKISSRSLHQVYHAFNTASHIVTSLSQEQEHRKTVLSQGVIPGLKTKQGIFDLEVLGVWLGIDIYETYLHNSKPTVFLDDPRLFDLVAEGIGLVIFWQDFFAKNKVAAVVVSHDCYLNLGVVCKVAYQARVPVYLPNPTYPTYVDRPLSIHTYFENYRQMFRRLSTEEQMSGIALAKGQLERRLDGEVGVDMPYATKSAFGSFSSEKRVLRESDKIKVLICSHCFYDNPHAYPGNLFLDFCEWLRYLGTISEQTDYDWYLKVHPDPMPGTLETIRGILAEFPRITIVPYDTSHHQLAKEGIDFALTVYGSVGGEYPALGVQVINASYNRHVAYDFNWHPKSLKEYEYYLLNLDKLHKDINLEELYEFYYMQYYYIHADDLIFKSFRQTLLDLTTEQMIGTVVYGYFLDQLTDSKHQEIINNLQKFIDSGKHHLWSRGPE